MMFVAIVGSRNYHDLDRVREFVRKLPAGTVVVSGGARGVDRIAVAEAKRCNLEVLVYPADWATHGRSAGFKRNQQIVDAADLIIAFWDGNSPGTQHTIRLAKKARKSFAVIQA